MASNHLSGGTWGINFRVTDLDAMVTQLRAGGGNESANASTNGGNSGRGGSGVPGNRSDQQRGRRAGRSVARDHIAQAIVELGPCVAGQQSTSRSTPCGTSIASRNGVLHP